MSNDTQDVRRDTVDKPVDMRILFHSPLDPGASLSTKTLDTYYTGSTTVITEDEVRSAIDKIKSSDTPRAHLLEDRLLRSLVRDIASGEVKSIRTARRICGAALDSEKVLTFRYYDEP